MQQLISCPQQLRLETYSIAMHWAYHIRSSKANTFMNKIDLLKRISLATDTWPQVQASSVRSSSARCSSCRSCKNYMIASNVQTNNLTEPKRSIHARYICHVAASNGQQKSDPFTTRAQALSSRM